MYFRRLLLLALVGALAVATIVGFSAFESRQQSQAPVVLIGHLDTRPIGESMDFLAGPHFVRNLAQGNIGVPDQILMILQEPDLQGKTLLVELDGHAFLENRFWYPNTTMESQRLRPYLPAQIEALLTEQRDWRFALFAISFSWARYFRKFYWEFDHTLEFWQHQFYHLDYGYYQAVQVDPLFEEREKTAVQLWSFVPELISGLKKAAVEKGASLVVFTRPQFNSDPLKSQYPRQVASRIREALSKEGISYFDYSDLLQNANQLFENTFFLKPDGIAIVARHLLNDLHKHSDTDVREAEVLNACQEALQKFCVGERSSQNCLLRHAQEVSGVCRSGNIARLVQTPCRLEIAQFCADVSEHDLKGCIAENLAQASPECQLRMQGELKANPCLADEQKNCANTLPSERDSCMRLHYQNLNPNCQASRRDYTGVCAEDNLKFCPELSGANMFACLREHFAELAPKCRGFMKPQVEFANRPSPCRNDLERLCQDLPFDKREVCLWQNYDKLSGKCHNLTAAIVQGQPCYKDSMALCGVEPEASDDKCLLRNLDKLSRSCTQRMERLLRIYPCRLEWELYCSNTDEFLACALEHYLDLGPRCKAAIF